MNVKFLCPSYSILERTADAVRRTTTVTRGRPPTGVAWRRGTTSSTTTRARVPPTAAVNSAAVRIHPLVGQDLAVHTLAAWGLYFMDLALMAAYRR